LLHRSVILFCTLEESGLVRCVKNTLHILSEQHAMRMNVLELCIIAFAPRLAELLEGGKMDTNQMENTGFGIY
jgi:hypothetical protein